jgi:hypothetical protein
MNIDATVVRFLLLLVPGLVATFLYRRYTGRKTKQYWKDSITVLFFSIISYLLLGFFLTIRNYIWSPPKLLTFFDAVLNDQVTIQWDEVAWASVIAVLLGFGASYIQNYGVLILIGRKAKATRRSGHEDLWSYFHNADNDWYFIRDHKLNLVYYGSIRAYSDFDQDVELILEDISVFRNEGEPENALYETPRMYISRNRNELSIEIPKKTSYNKLQ